MSTAFLIVWGCLWTLVFSVAAQIFHVEYLVIHVPVAMTVYCAARRRPIDAWVVAWFVGWVAALLAGGARGPALFALIAVCAVAVFGRRRLKLQSNPRLATTVVAVCVLWSLLFVLFTAMVGGPSFWRSLFVISPLSAALTGAFSLLNTALLRRVDPHYTSGSQDGPKPLRAL